MRDLLTLKNMISEVIYVLDHKQRRWFIYLIFVILFGSFWEMLGVSVVFPILQVLIDPEKLMGTPFVLAILNYFGGGKDFLLKAVCLGCILIYLFKNIFIFISSCMQIRYKTNLLRKLSVLMMDSYMNRSYSFFVETNSGEIIRGITFDTSAVHDIVEMLLKLCSEGFAVLLICISILMIDPFIAMTCLLLGVICFLLLILTSKKKTADMGKKNMEAVTENNKLATQIIGGIKDIFVRQKRGFFLQKFEKSCEQRRVSVSTYQIICAIPERVIEVFCIIGVILILFFRMKFGKGETVEELVPTLGVFGMALFRVLPAVSRSIGYVNGLVYHRLNLESAYSNIKQAREYLERKRKSEDEIDDEEIFKFEDIVELEHVYWKYNERSEYILSDLTMRFHKGESVGIIGESGAGKSTLSDILMGLYEPLNGTVKADGVSIYNNPFEWSKIIGYVPQTVFLLDDTIKNNILFGNNPEDEEKIWDALEKANLKDFVQKLPDQLETMVGERGIRFSGGQRQRLAIARALYYNPDIIVLDEATSALDNDTEAAVMDAISNLQGEKTLFIIAHRLSTISNCDKIYRIQDGKAWQIEKASLY